MSLFGLIKLFGLINRFAGNVQPDFLESGGIDGGKNDRAVQLSSAELRKRLERAFGGVILGGTDGKGNQRFVCMKAGIMIPEKLGFQATDRLDNFLGDQFDLIGNPGKLLQRIQKRRGGGAEKGGCFSGDKLSVWKLDADGRLSRLLGSPERRSDHTAKINSNPCLGHNHFAFINGFVINLAKNALAACVIIAAHNFLLGGIADRIIVLADGQVRQDGARKDVLPGLLEGSPTVCSALTEKVR